MPFELIGFEHTSRENREEDMSGVDEVGLFGIKLKKPSWKRFKRNVGTTWKKAGAVATGKAFHHKKKGQSAEIKTPVVPGAPPRGPSKELSTSESRALRAERYKQAVNEAMSKYGLSGKTILTDTEWTSVWDDAISKVLPPGSEKNDKSAHYARANINGAMIRMGLTRHA